MSAATICDAFAPMQSIYAEQVRQATFGHLAPEPRRTYTGTILFVNGEYGDTVPVKVRFEGLDDSPWFFTDMDDHIYEQSKRFEPGTVLIWAGTYTRFKNGKSRFSGRTRAVKI